MSRLIKILNTVSIYSNYDEHTQTSHFLMHGNIVDFNRIKRRNGIDWMEILIDGQKRYIKKNTSQFFKLKEVKILDDSCTVIFFKLKNEFNYGFKEVFTSHKFEDKDQGIIQMRRYYEVGTKEKCINLYYDKDVAEVSKSVLAKGEKTIITSENGDILEILYGKKVGYILGDVSYYENKNWWIIVVCIIVALGVGGGSLYALIDSGRTVTGSILVIPGVIITALIVVFIKFILIAFNLIFETIRKRF